MHTKIGIIICYFGKWPEWFPYFLKSCSYNKIVDWLFFADHSIDKYNESSNLKYFHFSVERFNKLASIKLGFKVSIQNPYKLCDFKPTYGKIFEDYLTDYEFWGYSDIDMIYGDIRSFIDPRTLKTYDIINPYQDFVSGAFCLFRNSNYINSLYKKVYQCRQKLQDAAHFGLDENIQPKPQSIYINTLVIRSKYYILYLINQLLTNPFGIFYWKEFRYRFQWYWKKKRLFKAERFNDITDVILGEMNKINLNVLFRNFIWSDKYLDRINKKSWRIIWDNGKLIEDSIKKPIMAFHFIKSKQLPFFYRGFSVIPDKIILTLKGLNSE